LLLALLGLISLAGCNAGRAFIASPSDYADYRRVRVANDIDERMAATWYYLEHRPDGPYRERLQRYFDKAEPVFFKVRRRSLKGLEAYLRALPDGPHASAALEELMTRRNDARREELALRLARVAGLRLDRERKKRKRASELLGWWLTSLLDEALWDRPLSQAPTEFVVRYRLALPRPVCEPDVDEPDHRRCYKSVARDFRVAADGKRVERRIAFDVELELDESWHLQRASIAGGGLFVATAEARTQRAIDERDEGGVASAAADFVGRLSAELAAGEVACNGGTNADGATLLDCEGLRLVVEPGRGGGDDILLVERVSPTEPGAEPPEADDDDADASADDDDDADDDGGADDAGDGNDDDDDDDGEPYD